MALHTNPAAKAAFDRMLAAVAAEGARAGQALRAEHFQIQRRYRRRLADGVIAGRMSCDTYMAGYRSELDERNVRVVERYLVHVARASLRRAA